MTEEQLEGRLDEILGMIERIASMDLSHRLPVSKGADSVDAVAARLNMLAEELEANVVERSKLEHSVAALEVANRELEAFSNALAHDLRNPLLIVTNFSHHLRETLGDSLGEQEADDLQRIRDAGHHMIYLLDDLRDLAEVNRAEFSRAEVDLSAEGREIIDDLRARVPDRDVRFEAEPGIKAVGDRALLRILLNNLIQNAWKYTGPSDDAWIELGVVEGEDEGPIYHVGDNGIGFDNADHETIFRAFERLHTRAEIPGSGLGLATVERIVRRHGGRVWGEGILGEGAVFRFTLGSSSTDDLATEDRAGSGQMG